MSKENFSIVEFNPDDKEQMDLIASIHTSVLPDSFVVMMGNLFMKKFYYKALPDLGYLKCFLARLDGKYVGMIVTNKKPFSLIRSAIPHHYILISWVMGISMLFSPSRISTVLRLWRYKPDPKLKEFEDSGKAFEILTIGVLEPFRTHTLSNGKKISHMLLHHVVKYYLNSGYQFITGQILKENKSALGFYDKYKAKYIQSSTNEKGVIMDLPLSNIPIA